MHLCFELTIGLCTSEKTEEVVRKLMQRHAVA